MTDGFLGEIAILLIGLILLIVLIPIIVGMLIAWALGTTGSLYYMIVMLVAVASWLMFVLWYY